MDFDKRLGYRTNEEPGAKDSIYTEKYHYTLNACLNWMPDHSLAYIEGFKLLGDIGVNHVANHSTSQDLLVYPIGLAYRHHLELLIKAIINTGYSLLERNQNVPKIHSLLNLWLECKSILKQVFTNSDDDKASIISIENVIKELSEIDPNGENFRYPSNRDGSRSLLDLKILNLGALAESVCKVSQLLEGVHTRVSVYLEQKQEFENEYRNFDY